MSEFHAQKTCYKDRECLVQALNAQGYNEIEVHDVAQQLYDYTGKATRYLDMTGDKANVIVRRHIVGGAANYLGFRLAADGTYEAIVSEYDAHKHNAEWMKGLKRHYTEKTDMKTASKLGLKLLSRKVVNGKVQLKFMDRRG